MTEIRHAPHDPGLHEDIPRSRVDGGQFQGISGISDGDPHAPPHREAEFKIPDAPPLEEDDIFMAFQDSGGRHVKVNVSKVGPDHPVWGKLKEAYSKEPTLGAEPTGQDVNEALDEKLQRPARSEWRPPQALEVDPEEAARLSGNLLGEVNGDQTQFRVYAADKKTGRREAGVVIGREGATVDIRTPAIQKGFTDGDVLLLVFNMTDGTKLVYAYNGQTHAEIQGRDTPTTLDYRGRPKQFIIGARQQLGDPGEKMNSSQLSEVILPASMLKDLPGYSEPAADDPRIVRTTEPNPFAQAAMYVRMAEETS